MEIDKKTGAITVTAPSKQRLAAACRFSRERYEIQNIRNLANDLKDLDDAVGRCEKIFHLRRHFRCIDGFHIFALPRRSPGLRRPRPCKHKEWWSALNYDTRKRLRFADRLLRDFENFDPSLHSWNVYVYLTSVRGAKVITRERDWMESPRSPVKSGRMLLTGRPPFPTPRLRATRASVRWATPRVLTRWSTPAMERAP
ncbi:hypothetical protein VTK26DRAFT_1757 [Humicola hyalothermophila]